MKLAKLINYLEELFPIHYACKWDTANGLQIGNLDQQIKNVYLALDPSKETIKKAIIKEADLIITHHPLFFKPAKNIDTSTPMGKNIATIISNNIALYSAHTNMDAAPVGINYELAKLEDLDLTTAKPIEITYSEKLFKYTVYVPAEAVDYIRITLGEQGAGHIGNYSHCNFEATGTGHFKPLAGTNPHIGKEGHIESITETRIETIAREDQLSDIIKAVNKAHPYEEVAYDIYPLQNQGQSVGIGLSGIRNSDGKKIAVSSGSGGSLIQTVYDLGVKEFITGEVGYHDLLLAKELGLKVIVKGHYETEAFYMKILAKKIATKFPELNAFC